jgi:arsenate reductase
MTSPSAITNSSRTATSPGNTTAVRPTSAAQPTIAAQPTTAAQRTIAEFLGSLLLAAIVIGSGIAAERLSPADIGLQLLENSLATALGLFAIILMFGAVSGAHFNPVVTLADTVLGNRSGRDVLAYLPAQTLGCIAGAVLANAMFGEQVVAWSTNERLTWAHALSEAVATAGLVLVIFALVRTDRAHLAPAAVGAYIGAAYFFTSSTSFANPAITVGRMFSDTFAGIATTSAPGFIAAQLVGGALGVFIVRYLYPAAKTVPAQP